MKIPEDTLNACLYYCIEQYVRLENHRSILYDHWFKGLSTKELADKYHLSTTAISDIFRMGDKIILRAAKMSEAKTV